MKKITLFLLVFTFSSSISVFAQTVNDASFMQIIVDRTGSMIQSRLTGNSRWVDALDIAEKDLNDAKIDTDNAGVDLFVAVATFESSGGYVEHLDFGSYADAIDVINDLRLLSVGGATPLADALCTGADEILDETTAGNYKSVIAFYTDMTENASTGECSGDDWINQVTLKYIFGFLGRDLTFNASMFVTDDDLTQGPSSRSVNALSVDTLNEKTVDIELLNTTRFSTQVTTQATTAEEIELFEVLVNYFGGSLKGYTDTQLDPVEIIPEEDDDCSVYVPCY